MGSEKSEEGRLGAASLIFYFNIRRVEPSGRAR